MGYGIGLILATVHLISAQSYLSWSKHGDRCYKIFPRLMSMQEGSSFCRDFRGDSRLVEPDNYFKKDFIEAKLMQGGTDMFLMGIRDTTGNGDYRWIKSNLSIPSTYWASGEPSRNERCVTLQRNLPDHHVNMYKLKVEGCSGNFKIICEKAAVEVNPPTFNVEDVSGQNFCPYIRSTSISSLTGCMDYCGDSSNRGNCTGLTYADGVCELYRYASRCPRVITSPYQITVATFYNCLMWRN